MHMIGRHILLLICGWRLFLIHDCERFSIRVIVAFSSANNVFKSKFPLGQQPWLNSFNYIIALIDKDFLKKRKEGAENRIVEKGMAPLYRFKIGLQNNP